MTWVQIEPTASSQAHILSSHSLNQAAMAAHAALYRTVMFGPSSLTRSEREAIAVAVSAANNCHY